MGHGREMEIELTLVRKISKTITRKVKVYSYPEDFAEEDNITDKKMLAAAIQDANADTSVMFWGASEFVSEDEVITKYTEKVTGRITGTTEGSELT